MKIEIGNFGGGFWVRSSLRALLAWLWFDHGRWVSFYGDKGFPTVGIEIIILISIIITLALETFYRSGPEGEGDE